MYSVDRAASTVQHRVQYWDRTLNAVLKAASTAPCTVLRQQSQYGIDRADSTAPCTVLRQNSQYGIDCILKYLLYEETMDESSALFASLLCSANYYLLHNLRNTVSSTTLSAAQHCQQHNTVNSTTLSAAQDSQQHNTADSVVHLCAFL